MDNKPKQKPNDSSWKDENDRMTNPNRRQEEDHNLDTPSRSGQKASKKDVGSEPRESDRLDESQRDRQQTDTSRRQWQSEE